ncbi:uncharacterized protein [Antedon mediterranea]|uniref:uncharacterized protein n=1 Tax=Antedon mediterranea TaxID=105859 RepID=UPI003AF724DC
MNEDIYMDYENTTHITDTFIARDELSVKVVTYSIIGIMAAIENAIALLIFSSSKRFRKKRNIFLFSLSLADFIVGVLSCLVYFEKVYNSPSFGAILEAMFLVSVFSICAVSVERLPGAKEGVFDLICCFKKNEDKKEHNKKQFPSQPTTSNTTSSYEAELTELNLVEGRGRRLFHRNNCKNLCADCIWVSRDGKELPDPFPLDDIPEPYALTVCDEKQFQEFDLNENRAVWNRGSVTNTSDIVEVLGFSSSDDDEDYGYNNEYSVTVDVHAPSYSGDILPPIEFERKGYSTLHHSDYFKEPRRNVHCCVVNFTPEITVIERGIPVNPPKDIDIDMFLLEDLFEAQKKQSKRSFFSRKQRDFNSDIEAVMRGESVAPVKELTNEEVETAALTKKSKSDRIRKAFKKLFSCFC